MNASLAPCPSDDAIQALVEGRLIEEERAPLAAHVDACASCRSLVVELARGLVAFERDDGAALLRSGDRIGRYRVLEEAGTGGMAHVYAAYDPHLDRRVALKVWRWDPTAPDDADARRRLKREARALARVVHPHVTTVFDVDADAPRPYLTMEYVAGTTLDRWLRDEARDPRAILAMFLAAGEGLAAAHEAGIVHRDFKAANVLVGSAGEVKVSDFGLAHALLGERASVSRIALDDGNRPSHALLEAPSTHAGTPGYIAPEQLEGRATARSDQYAFAVAVERALDAARRHAAPPKADAAERRAERPVLSEAVVRAIARSRAPRAEDRFPSMAPLLDVLRGELRGATTGDRGTRLAYGVASTIALLGVAMPALVLLRNEGESIGTSPLVHLGWMGTLASLVAIAAWVSREALTAPYARRLLQAGFVHIATQALATAGGLAASIPHSSVQTFHLLLQFVAFLLVTITLERALWPAAMANLVAFGGAALWPAHRFSLIVFANASVAGTLAFAWRTLRARAARRDSERQRRGRR